MTDFKDFYDRAYILARLQTRYPDEIVRLINSGDVELPLWLRKEMKEWKGVMLLEKEG